MHPDAAVGWRAVVARLKLYGLKALVKFAFLDLKARFLSAASKNQTLRAIAATHSVTVVNSTGSVNEPAVLAQLEELNADVAIGMFSEKADGTLRRISKRGLLLMHYSLLPRFAGREPTFWTMLEDPSAAGITFFKANRSFDAGTVVLQAGKSLSGVKSLHSAITMLSELAGQHITKAVLSFAHSSHSSSEVEQNFEPRQMRSWPNQSDVRRFHARGLELV